MGRFAEQLISTNIRIVYMLYKYELCHYMPVSEYFDVLKLY